MSITRRVVGQPNTDDNLSVLLVDITEHLCDRYSFASEDDAYLTAVWIVHCWLIAAFDKTVYLLMISPDIEYGKSELGHAVKDLCPNSRLAVHPSTAALTKFTLNGFGVLIIDEFDRTIRRNESDKQTFYGIIDGGIDRAIDGYMVTDQQGQVVFRNVFGPKMFLGLKTEIDGTLKSRSIRIIPRKGTLEDQNTRRERQALRPVGERVKQLRERLEAISSDRLIRKARNKITPDNLNTITTLNDGTCLFNRDSDCWIPLITVGDIASIEDGKRIRDIAANHTSGKDADDVSISEDIQIDNALLELIRKGRLPVDNYYHAGKAPISPGDINKVAITNNDLGQEFKNRRTKDVLTTITLYYSIEQRKAELRIKSRDLETIASNLPWDKRTIRKIYKDANRTRTAKGANDMVLSMYHNGPTSKVMAIDWSRYVFGIRSEEDE